WVASRPVRGLVVYHGDPHARDRRSGFRAVAVVIFPVMVSAGSGRALHRKSLGFRALRRAISAANAGCGATAGGRGEGGARGRGGRGGGAGGRRPTALPPPASVPRLDTRRPADFLPAAPGPVPGAALPGRSITRIGPAKAGRPCRIATQRPVEG